MLRKWSYKEFWTDQGLPLPGVLAGDNPALTRMHLGMRLSGGVVQRGFKHWQLFVQTIVLKYYGSISCVSSLQVTWDSLVANINFRYWWYNAHPDWIRPCGKINFFSLLDIVTKLISFTRRHLVNELIFEQITGVETSGLFTNGWKITQLSRKEDGIISYYIVREPLQ